MSGIGETPVGPVEGTHVFGFFRDGKQAQFPVIMGTIPGIPEEGPDSSSGDGFSDPNEKYPKDEEKHGLEESDLTRLSRYRWDEEDSFTGLVTEQKEEDYPPLVQAKKDNRVKGVLVANGHGSWSEPETKFDAKYPYNHVMVTDSVHVYEMDDTLNKERIHEYHRSGTFREIYPKGTMVTKVVRDNYEFVLGDEYINIRKLNESHGGNLFLNVEGDVYEFISGNVERQINGSVREVIGGNYHTHVNGDRTVNIEGSEAVKVHEDVTIECYNNTQHTLGNTKQSTEGSISIDSPKKIELNSIGGNIFVNAQPHPALGILPACNKTGKVNITSGSSISMKSEGNTNIFSSNGGCSMITDNGSVVIAGGIETLVRSNKGPLTLNSAATTHIVSPGQIWIDTPFSVGVRCNAFTVASTTSINLFGGTNILMAGQITPPTPCPNIVALAGNINLNALGSFYATSAAGSIGFANGQAEVFSAGNMNIRTAGALFLN